VRMRCRTRVPGARRSHQRHAGGTLPGRAARRAGNAVRRRRAGTFGAGGWDARFTGVGYPFRSPNPNILGCPWKRLTPSAVSTIRELWLSSTSGFRRKLPAWRFCAVFAGVLVSGARCVATLKVGKRLGDISAAHAVHAKHRSPPARSSRVHGSPCGSGFKRSGI
jgi:hypothetical protein